MIQAAQNLCSEAESLSFPAPITHTYNPLSYAKDAHEQYLKRYANQRKRIIFLGMNPGPFGMMQTAVPFGEISIVRDWLGIHSGVTKPEREHPKRPIEGFECQRSEVSGRRLWSCFRDRFEQPEAFFNDHFVANYCPLSFLEASGRNFTPDKLPAAIARQLEAICDAHLVKIVGILQPQWIIGVGAFARKRADSALANQSIQIGQILHPSPASPAANRGWAEQAEKHLHELGAW
ncbi:MAG: hypothetical protein M2R45_02896 [Verrucomicrobia subdivision 3 bacterium]|nr:hypothetical protein [Limisphaerales bacterium]MCS1414748.1 hypothetical protein [Limisphaerales bacterium]